MTYGPIDFIALEFQGNKFKGEILANLLDLVDKDLVRVIDLVVILKDEDGEIEVRELQELDDKLISIFDPREMTAMGMVTAGDIEMVADTLANNTSAAILMFENLWAVKFKESIMEADGRVLMQQRIPHEVVLEALVDMANFDESAELAEEN
jgi:Family of unknown function (DUF6325)